jgi:hypothetical protein
MVREYYNGFAGPALLTRMSGGSDVTFADPDRAGRSGLLTCRIGARNSDVTRSLLRLQERCGNRYVRRMVATLQRDNDDSQTDDSQKPPPLVGQDRAVDPKDNICKLQWTLGGKKWLLPSGVECDPGMFGIPGHGGPFKYPSDQPAAPSSPAGPTTNPKCPGRENPLGGCCPDGQAWGPTGCAPAPGPQLCRPLPCEPGKMLDNCGNMCANWTPPPLPPGPGDYNVPDPNANTAVA